MTPLVKSSGTLEEKSRETGTRGNENDNRGDGTSITEPGRNTQRSLRASQTNERIQT